MSYCTVEDTPNPSTLSHDNSDDISDVVLYTAGVCPDESGRGGYGYAVVISDDFVLQGSGWFLATNDVHIKLTAIIEGLRVVPPEFKVKIVSNSVYVVNAFENHCLDQWRSNGWKKGNDKAVENRELWEALISLIAQHPSVSFALAEKHTYNQFNEMCDRLATQTIDSLEITT